MNWRPAARGDLGLAGLWAATAAVGLLAAPHLPMIARLCPPCAVHALTGVPCPSCGATRAALALARGDLVQALALNPLATLGMVALVAGGLAAPLWVSARAPLPTLAGPLPRGWRPAAWGALAAHWGYLILTR